MIATIDFIKQEWRKILVQAVAATVLLLGSAFGLGAILPNPAVEAEKVAQRTEQEFAQARQEFEAGFRAQNKALCETNRLLWKHLHPHKPYHAPEVCG